MVSFSKLDYCQYLLSSPINFTVTHLAEHLEGVSHDRIKRYLQGEKLAPRLLWENVRRLVEVCEEGYLVFDDTVIDKRHAKHMELVRRLYSGNEHRVIRGIGLISCLYVNPHSGKFWVIDYRLYDPDGDGKTKLDHVIEMFQGVCLAKSTPFQAVLMDSWYAAQKVIAAIDQAHKLYYCPLKRNRLVDDSGGVTPYQRIDQLHWSETELDHGKLMKIRKFPKAKKVKLFRVTVSTDRTEFVATNNIAQDSTTETQQVCRTRWKIESRPVPEPSSGTKAGDCIPQEFHEVNAAPGACIRENVHRELKQLTGMEACQCRKARIQRNHIACALLVWNRLKQLAYQSGQTVYQLKQGLLSQYLISQLKSPTIPIVFA